MYQRTMSAIAEGRGPALRGVVGRLLLGAVFLLWAQPVPAQEEAVEGALPGEDVLVEEQVLSSPSTFRAESEERLSVLMVHSRPEGARVFVDGEERGATPLTIEDLEEGAHEVILYLPDYGAFRQIVEGSGGRIFVDLESEKGLGVGFLAVRTEPEDARVDVDGRRMGLSPLEIPLEAGRHTVHVSKAGYKAVDADVEVEAEGRRQLVLNLEPEEGALLVISSPVGGEVLLDGEAVGQAWEPLRVEDVPPGPHSIRVEKSGYRAWENEDLVVRSAETTTVLAALVPERDYSWVRLHTDPVGATVWMDGRRMGVAGEEGLGFKASKGAHRLFLEVDPAEHPGFEPLEVTVSFSEDEIDYSDSPLELPPVDENFTHALALVERGQLEEALGFLDRVSPEHASYGEARLLVVEVLQELGRVTEIPLELEMLLERPEYRNNPTLNTALGFWALEAAREVADAEAVSILSRAVEALERATQTIDLFPPGKRDELILKTYYYLGMASEILFNLTGEKRFVKKGAQAWEVFFVRLDRTPEAIEANWIEKARNHRRSLDFLAKKLGG